MDKTLKGIGIACMIISTISVGYYFLMFLPQNEKSKEYYLKKDFILREMATLKQEMETKKEAENKAMNAQREAVNKSSCLFSADQEYRREWIRTCSAFRQKGDCRLPLDQARFLDERHTALRDECYKQH